jgi:O-succinylhomoserine sulfhydrylase
MTDSLKNRRFDTLAVRVGHHRTSEGEQSEPIFPTSSYVFDSAAQAAARFSGEAPGNIYSRFTNPTVRVFQERLAALEGGECCVATASGMSAILATCLALLRQGDALVSSKAVFGSTVMLFDNYIAKFGVGIHYVDGPEPERWARVIERTRPKLVFLETPSNPLTQVYDIRAIADLCGAAGALLVVDNCFCTPALQRPLMLGADLVIHSATKYIDGQGRCIGGAVVGDAERVGKEVFGVLRTAGPTMSPFNAWVFAKGLETLSLRMEAHSRNALQIARWLETQAKVARVFYPGLPSHPQHELAARQQTGFGGIVAFELEGGQPAAWRLIDAVRIFSITANLGDAKSTITHPATTTHGRLSPEQRAEAGIGDGLVRIAVGLEDPLDLIEDLEQAMAKV